MLTASVQPVPPRLPREYPTEWTIYSTRDDEPEQTPKRETAPAGAKEKEHAPQ